MEQMPFDGIELPYEVTGSGEPLLLVSTGPIADSFLPFVSAHSIADRYRLIRYQQRRLSAGAGGSAAVSFAQHASDAVALMGHLGVDRVHVAGHSTGAAIALQMAVDHPALVHSLVLLEPPFLSVPSAAAFFEQAAPALVAYETGDRETAMVLFLSMVCSLDWDTCSNLVEQHVPGGVARAIEDADNFFASYLPALSAWNFGVAQAAAIRQPILSVWGTDTQRLFADGQDVLRACFPQLEECVIDGVAHLLHFQRVEPVARGVAAFLARHPVQRLLEAAT